MKRHTGFFAMVLAAQLLASCSGQDPAPQGEAASPSPAKSAEAGPGVGGVSGAWTGSWRSTGPDEAEGSFEIEFAQEDTLLGGKATLEGTSCMTSGFVSGTVDGTDISFSLVVEGEPKATYQGAVAGDTVSGTFENECGEAGTWEATKSSA